MRRFAVPGLLVPLVLALAGVTLIVLGSVQLDAPGESLEPIPDPSRPVGQVTPSPVPGSFAASPSGTPIPDDWVAVQIAIEAVDLNVLVKHATQGQGGFPPDDAAYILYQSSEPGRGTNTYMVGHALQNLFKRLWNVQLGDEVKIRMSDGVVLRYLVTEVHPNVSCPDSRVDPMPNPPLALQYAPPGCPGARWIRPTEHERLTLQTSQGFNRNYGELIIVALPI